VYPCRVENSLGTSTTLRLNQRSGHERRYRNGFWKR